MRSLFQRLTLALAAVAGLLGTRPATANAQKALVYCPVAIDATGCNAIVTALTGPAFPLGVDRGYDGTDGTVDLEAVDLFAYSVFVVPSLADGSTVQPYARLRDPEVVEHLKAALIGRIALWSGSPDQGATNRAMKDALIQNLVGWAGGAYGTAKGPGLVALLDASSTTASRYDWVRAITPVPVTSDAALLIYGAVRALDPRATAILTAGAGPIAYDNMATFGFQVPNGAAGVSLDAVGQTGTTQGGQVVLVTMEAGNTSGALVKTDKDDYAPGQTVTITGTGWQAGETIKLALHMDPLRDSDTELTATADGNGAFTNTDFAPGDYDIGVRFVLTATGQTSGRRAQATFTDGNKVTFSTTAGGAEVTDFGTVPSNQCVRAFVQERQGSNIETGNHPARSVALTSTSGTTTFFASANCSGGSVSSVTIPLNTSNIGFSFRTTASGTFTITGDAADFNANNDASATITIGAAPTATNDSYSTNEDEPLTVAAPGVLTNDTGSPTPTAVLVSQPPAGQGTVALSANGGFTFTPGTNFNGSTSFTYQAQNTAGTSATATVSMTVNPVNDAPSFTKGANQTVLEDAAAQTVSGWATAISAGPTTDETSQTLTFSATNDNPTLFSVQPAIAPNGTLTYTPVANAFGVATVTLSLQDNGGTANGGVDTAAPQTFTITITGVNDAPSFTKGADQTVLEDAGAQSVANWATAISAGPNEVQGLTFQVSTDNPSLFSAGPSISATGTLTYTTTPNANGAANITVTLKDDGGTANGGVDASAPQTFTITVNAVNDAPSFTKGADQTVFEDASAQTISGWATNISAGPPDEEGQALDFVVTNDNNTLFSVQPAVAADGTLTYTPALNAYGTATVTVKLHDDGGTASGGVETSPAQTFTIIITGVNDAPSFTKGPDQTVNEDAGAQSVPSWATAISAGPNEGSQLVDFVVSNDNTTLFSTQPAVDATGTLTYTPAPNANGSATVTIRIHDNSGTANGGVDASADQTFTITVRAVNDAPSFTKGGDETVNEDAGAQTVPNWATGMSAGPADESGQTLTFLVSNNNTALFSAQPSIAPNGTLTYTPALDAFGTATVTVKLQDNGGTAYGGIDTSAEQTFTITVNAVNDAPSFSKGADQTVNEDAGAQTVTNWATAISAGPNESSQTVTFQVTGNSNSGLFSAQPDVDPTGKLTYTPATNANGSATITLELKDNGGTADGGVDTSAPQTFVITVRAVNDAPAYGLITSTTSAEDAGPQSVPNALTAPSPGPSDEAGQVLSITILNDNPTLFLTQPSISLTTGTLAYTANPNANGMATVTVKVMDNGGTAYGGVDVTTKTMTITVTPVNDAPEITAFTSPAAPNAINTMVTASGSFTDVDLGDATPDTHTATINWGDGSPVSAATVNGNTGTTRSVNGSHTYAAAGVYTLTLTVTDAASATDTELYKYVVVYDASGGFVTGGGWINSPAGAYYADPSLTGKANFGFVSKYKKGQATPDGNTEFQYQAGNLNFKATGFEWLVISGARAQFKGVGTINGSGNYGFLLTAIDGQTSGGGGTDKFRMKIWIKNANGTDGPVVYDNQLDAADDSAPTTVLGGGSIQIHDK